MPKAPECRVNMSASKTTGVGPQLRVDLQEAYCHAQILQCMRAIFRLAIERFLTMKRSIYNSNGGCLYDLNHAQIRERPHEVPTNAILSAAFCAPCQRVQRMWRMVASEPRSQFNNADFSNQILNTYFSIY